MRILQISIFAITLLSQICGASPRGRMVNVSDCKAMPQDQLVELLVSGWEPTKGEIHPIVCVEMKELKNPVIRDALMKRARNASRTEIDVVLNHLKENYKMDEPLLGLFADLSVSEDNRFFLGTREAAARVFLEGILPDLTFDI